MKTLTALSLVVLLTGAESFDSFWQTFKTAVSRRDVDREVDLTSGADEFHVTMSGSVGATFDL